MTDQKFIDWNPVDNIPKSIFVEQLIDDYDGLRIILQGKNPYDRKLEIFFFDRIFYRNTDESYFLRTIDNIGKRGSSLLIVNNSLLTKWIHNESYGVYQDKNITHYLILSGNDCIDILTSTPPKVSWL